LMLIAVWRYSFDFCGSTELDPNAYIDQHLDILLRGLLAHSRPAPRTNRSATKS